MDDVLEWIVTIQSFRLPPTMAFFRVMPSDTTTLNLLLSCLTFVVTAITAIASVFIALLALRHTLKPRLHIDYYSKKYSKEKRFSPEEIVSFRFDLSSTGKFRAQTAITDLKLYVNFEPEFEPLELRYGSKQEHIDKTVKTGKDNCKYLVAEGICLFYGEPSGEEIVVTTKMPKDKGPYCGWISGFSKEGSQKVYKFHIEVV